MVLSLFVSLFAILSPYFSHLYTSPSLSPVHLLPLPLSPLPHIFIAMMGDHVYHKQSEGFVRFLIEQGLDDELLNQFVYLAEDTPLHMVFFKTLLLFILLFTDTNYG
jgi:hypothetical protein